MRYLLAATAIAGTLSLAGCGHAKGDADGGPTVSRNYSVGEFNQVESSGPYDVDVQVGGKTAVSASGPEKLIEHTLVEVRDGKLVIRPEQRGNSFTFGHGTHGTVRFTVTVPQIVAASTGGYGDIRIDRAQGDSFDADVGGSGGIEIAQLDVKSLNAAIGGSGSIKAAGKAATASYAIGGSGEIDASGVSSDNAKISIAGSGNVAADVKSAADVSVVGSGDVKVTGGAKCNVTKAGSGNVDC